MKVFKSGKKNVLILSLSIFVLYLHCACGPAKTVNDEIIPTVPAEVSYPAELATVSSQGISYSRKAIESKMLPRGSAIITSSGSLASKGITAIIHAAPGSGQPNLAPQFEPTLQSVASSVKNSMILANKHQHKVIAIPFIGGGIFIQRIGTTPDKLAEAIVRAALETQSNLQIRFITAADPNTPGDSASTTLFKSTLAKLLAEAQFQSVGTSAQVLQGSINDFILHTATVIVNAANMEVKFGGGISGSIATATGNSAAIDKEAADAVAQFNIRALEKFSSNK